MSSVEGSSLPQDPAIAAWGKVWIWAYIGFGCNGQKSPFAISFLTITSAVLLSVSLGALNGYVLTKWCFRGDNIVFAFVLFGCFIPFPTILIPMGYLLGFLKVAGTIPGLILVQVVYGIRP